MERYRCAVGKREIRKLKLGGRGFAVVASLIEFLLVDSKPGSLHCASPRVCSEANAKKRRGLASVGMTVLAQCRREGLLYPMDTEVMKGVTPAGGSGYNEEGMLPDAPSEAQSALARVLAALPGVPAPLSGSVAFAGASQPVR